MVCSRLLDRLRLGALHEIRVVEARGEAIAFLLGGGNSLRQPRPFCFEIDNALERERKLASSTTTWAAPFPSNVESWIDSSRASLLIIG